MSSSWHRRAIPAEAIAFELLQQGLSVVIPVTGSSMLPFLRSEDLVTLAPLDRGPALGDVVAFRRPDGRMVLHRVVSVEPQRILVRGDAARVVDGWITPDQVTARVVAVERGGTALRFGLGSESKLIALASRFGLLVWVLAPCRVWIRNRARVAESTTA